MKKLFIAVMGLFAVITFLDTAYAADTGDTGGWRHHRGWHNSWNDRWGAGHYHDGWYHPGWGYSYRAGWGWGWGPGIVVVPDYYYDSCFIRKVRRYDGQGNAYVMRVRVCE